MIWVLRQIRLELKGEGYGILDYKVQMEFEPEFDPTGLEIGGSVAMKDAFLGAKDVPLFASVRLASTRLTSIKRCKVARSRT